MFSCARSVIRGYPQIVDPAEHADFPRRDVDALESSPCVDRLEGEPGRPEPVAAAAGREFKEVAPEIGETSGEQREMRRSTEVSSLLSGCSFVVS
jgi:hypothetical protein